jgi:outer membrane protein assembly factor BamB
MRGDAIQFEGLEEDKSIESSFNVMGSKMRSTCHNMFKTIWRQTARLANRGLANRRLAAGVISCALVANALVAPVNAEDGDWAQWRGPARDGRAASQSLLQSWPEGGPKLAWSFKAAGLGYSAVAVSEGRLYTMGQRGGDCFAICLDPKTGEELWAQRIDRGTEKGDYLTEWGGGPRSTPTIDGDLAYFLTDLGQLACLNTKDGSSVWSVHLVNDLGGKIPQWGYSESVLIDGDRALCTPGGENFMVGFNKKTGQRVYTSKGFGDGAQYVSIMKTTVGGIPIYITAAKPGLVAFHAETGELQFKSPTTGNNIAVIPTPIILGNEVYHSTAYKAGNTLLQLAAEGGKVSMKEVYHFDKESMENHHGGYVLDKGTVYGFSNALRGVWLAQDWKTGAILWSKKVGNGRSGSIAFADGLLYCYDDADGICYLTKPSKEGWEELGQVKLPEQTSTDRGRGAIWAHPVIANQKLFIRDQELIYAYDIAK